MNLQDLQKGAAGIFALVAGACPALADPVADFYKGKTVQMIVSSSAGGGYDALSRTIAKHMWVHIPGKPGMIVRNMPGAGGIVAMNWVANLAPKDGSVIAGVQNNVPFEPLMGVTRAKYDATKLNWLGTPSVETGTLIVWHTHPAKTIQDAMKMKIRAGSSGYNSAPSLYVRLLNELLGTKIDLVLGFRGQNGAYLAMEKGELDSYGTTFWSSLTATKKDWLKNNKIRILVQYGPEKEEALPNVPYGPDLTKNAADRALFEAAYAPLAAGRPFVMPAGIPADRIAALRKAFMDTMADPKFKKDADRIGLIVNKPRSGEQLQKQIVEAYKAPREVIERLRKIANPPKN
ncbi:MAG: Bug family tripartite tricarboxylate transporter substrate binding protein [Beijerinckiaceae bacterium]